MRTIKSIRGMARAAGQAREAGLKIGFVPTMGFFHEGHLSLIDKAAAETDLAVVSIFVNPLQFGQGEDFERYPRDLRKDRALARGRGCDVLFVPRADRFYPQGFKSAVKVRDLEKSLCGRSRPGHFEGVCTVVLKLLNVVRPHVLYLGRKDAQQAIILKRMIVDLELNVSVRICPIVREPDGLAMSSRNAYLSSEQRKRAPVLYEALRAGARSISGGERDPARVKAAMREVIESCPGAKPDYLEAVHYSNLETPAELSGQVLLAGAAWFGRTRLIDNLVVRAGRRLAARR